MTTALLFSTRSSGGPAGDPRGVRLPADLRSSGPVRSPSYRLGREVSNPNEVVDGQGKGKHPVHAAGPAMTGLSHQADGLEPAEDVLDARRLPEDRRPDAKDPSSHQADGLE